MSNVLPVKMGVINKLTTMDNKQKTRVITKIKTLYVPKKVRMSRREISSCSSSIEWLFDELEAELGAELVMIGIQKLCCSIAKGLDCSCTQAQLIENLSHVPCVPKY